MNKPRWIPVFFISLFSAVLLSAGNLIAASHENPEEDQLEIPGTGDSQKVLLLLARRFEELHPGTTVVIPESIGSGGGIRLVTEGTAVLARVARTLNEGEQEFGLTYRAFATSPVVFAVHPGVEGVASLTPEQIVGIYSGKIRRWSDLGGPSEKIYAIGREAGDSSHGVLDTHMGGFADIETHAQKTYYTTHSAVAAIEGHQFTIGYGPLAAFRGTDLKVLEIAETSPSEANVTSARYPLTVPFGIVYRSPLPSLARSFVDFLVGEDAAKVLTEDDCFPVGEK